MRADVGSCGALAMMPSKMEAFNLLPDIATSNLAREVLNHKIQHHTGKHPVPKEAKCQEKHLH